MRGPLTVLLSAAFLASFAFAQGSLAQESSGYAYVTHDGATGCWRASMPQQQKTVMQRVFSGWDQATTARTTDPDDKPARKVVWDRGFSQGFVGMCGGFENFPSAWKKILIDKRMFSGARMLGATFKNANLEGFDLTGVALEHANLSGAKFKGAILRGATFDGPAFDDNTDFTGADLSNAKFKNIELLDLDSFCRASTLEGATYDPQTVHFAEYNDDMKQAGIKPSSCTLEALTRKGLRPAGGGTTGAALAPQAQPDSVTALPAAPADSSLTR